MPDAPREPDDASRDGAGAPGPAYDAVPAARYHAAIPITGAVVLLAWAAWILVFAFARPDPYANGWIYAFETGFAGRAASIAHGTADGCAWWYLAVHCGLQDAWLVLLAWPAIVAGERTAARVPRLRRPIRALHGIAARHRGRAAAIGLPGLFLLVFFPFWSTGALVGAALGHLVGFRTSRVLTVVIGGHLASVAALLVVFDLIDGVAQSVDPRLPWAIVGVLLLVAVAGPVVDHLRGRRAPDDRDTSETNDASVRD